VVLTRLVDKATADYARQRELAIQQLHDASKSFDQTLITLSAGAIGLSVSYLRPSSMSELLVGAWVAFAVALAAALFSFQLVQLPLRLNAEQWSEAIKRTEKGLGVAAVASLESAEQAFRVSPAEKQLEKRAARWRMIVAAMHTVSLLSFTGGVVLLLIATAKGFGTQ
jgi:hypothetical protein